MPWCQLGPEHVDALALWPGRLHVERLELAHNPLGDQALARLASADWPALRCLDLEHCELSAITVASLADQLTAGSLQVLDLSYNPVDSACQALARLRGLRELHLRDCGISDDGLAGLATTHCRLEVLQLEVNELSGSAIAVTPTVSERLATASVASPRRLRP